MKPILMFSRWDGSTFSPWWIVWVETRNVPSNAERRGGVYGSLVHAQGHLVLFEREESLQVNSPRPRVKGQTPEEGTTQEPTAATTGAAHQEQKDFLGEEDPAGCGTLTPKGGKMGCSRGSAGWGQGLGWRVGCWGRFKWAPSAVSSWGNLVSA